MSDITDQDRMEALALLAETRLERIEKQQAEINRLQKVNSALLAAKDVEIVPPAIPEGFVIQELQKTIVSLHSDINRLREDGQKDYDGMREFQQKFIDASHEVERLRGILEDACRWHEQFPVQRVRETPGDR